MENSRNIQKTDSGEQLKSSAPNSGYAPPSDDLYENFKIISGSNVWPSSDPNDSPFDKFICKRCGKSIEVQMYGERYTNGPTFEEQAEVTLLKHLAFHHLSKIDCGA